MFIVSCLVNPLLASPVSDYCLLCCVFFSIVYLVVTFAVVEADGGTHLKEIFLV